MSTSENYRSKQALLVIVVFCLFVLAFLNLNWIITVGSVLVATAVAIYAGTLEPKPSHEEHH
ncbi:MAG TPA: hypothetical protein DCY27_05655 [Desulfobacterales bacterium]|nr:hypothetical protein [Desulfobacterales bacterium]